MKVKSVAIAILLIVFTAKVKAQNKEII